MDFSSDAGVSERDLKEREQETKSDLFSDMHYNNTTVDNMNKMCKGAYATLVSTYIIIIFSFSPTLSACLSLALYGLHTFRMNGQLLYYIYYSRSSIGFSFHFTSLLLSISLCASQLGEKYKAKPVVNFNFTTIHNWISKWNSEAPAHTPAESTSAFECSHSLGLPDPFPFISSLPSLAAASLAPTMYQKTFVIFCNGVCDHFNFMANFFPFTYEKSMAFVHANGCKVGSQPKGYSFIISRQS